MRVIPTSFDEVLLLEPDVYSDNRGYFMETWQAGRYFSLGLKETFLQDNISFSRKDVLRGLHFQSPNSQGKLATCLMGKVFDVVVDIRRDSKTFGKHFGICLSQTEKLQIYVPPGFAHGFIVLSDWALFSYKCTMLYSPASEHCILWNDPDIAIPWPVKQPVISAKDSQGVSLKEWLQEGSR